MSLEVQSRKMRIVGINQTWHMTKMNPRSEITLVMFSPLQLYNCRQKKTWLQSKCSEMSNGNVTLLWAAGRGGRQGNRACFILNLSRNTRKSGKEVDWTVTGSLKRLNSFAQNIDAHFSNSSWGQNYRCPLKSAFLQNYSTPTSMRTLHHLQPTFNVEPNFSPQTLIFESQARPTQSVWIQGTWAYCKFDRRVIHAVSTWSSAWNFATYMWTSARAQEYKMLPKQIQDQLGLVSRIVLSRLQAEQLGWTLQSCVLSSTKGAENCKWPSWMVPVLSTMVYAEECELLHRVWGTLSG